MSFPPTFVLSTYLKILEIIYFLFIIDTVLSFYDNTFPIRISNQLDVLGKKSYSIYKIQSTITSHIDDFSCGVAVLDNIIFR